MDGYSTPEVNDPEHRTREEILKDRSVLLYVIDQCNKFGSMDGNVKLEKCVFLSERELNQENLKFLNYEFFRYKHGPFSTGVLNDQTTLQKNELVNFVNGKVVPTRRGEQIIDLVKDELREKGIADIIERRVSDIADRRMSEITDMVYSLPANNGTDQTIKEVPPHQTLLSKVDSETAQDRLELDQNLLSTIEHLSDNTAVSRVSKAAESIKSGDFVRAE